ncbi:hypothetical protein SAY87_003173 [Trapa incisa]|uniref:Uncharacterized protein n=1 Tax=Trapa incisa TaxID=236973 RepID=A0AAN7QHE1_9MYRT|nr:hypothetical protein SAY87_003173 [Trapa incisa]
MPRSYLFGFGPRYSRHEPYRLNRAFIWCTQGYDNRFGRKGPNPNVVVWALVGAPVGRRGGSYLQYGSVGGRFRQVHG